jgi:cytosine/adenosine deaminase-related metal-dependent hydrolase
MQIYAASYLLPVDGPPVEGGAVAVASGRIVDLGTLATLRRIHGAPVQEFPGCVIMPGLVNAHSHLELTHFPSWKLRKGIDYTPRTYVDWVVQVIKTRRALTRDELVHSVREGICKSLDSGTTALGEIVTDRSLIPLYRESPLAGRLYCEAIGHDPAQCEMLVNELERTIAAFGPGRLQPGISPHAPHTVAGRFMVELTSLARRHALPTAIHLAESREEASFFHDTTGMIASELYPLAGWQDYLPPPRRTTPTAWVDSLGAFHDTTAAIHCVHVTPADVEILRARGVTAVLCPRSNDRLAVGHAPASLLKKAGVPLALGTDSLASNDSLSLWDEMRFLRRRFPGTFEPAEVLEMATLGAAQALLIDREVGTLTRGKCADFLVMRPGLIGSINELPEALIEQGHLEDVFISGARPVYP